LGAQSFRDFETWLVDNGSSDASLRLVGDLFPWVQVIALEHNMGFCKGNNVAIRRSLGDLVVLLNNDTLVDSQWLQELQRAAVERPAVSIFASRILQLRQPELLYSAGDSYAAYGLGYRRGEGSPADRYEAFEEVFSGCGCAVLYRRSMLDQIGLFDEDFFSNFEDVDLAFRARLAGHRCMYVPRSKVYHYGSGTAGVANPNVVYLTSRNCEYVFFKNMPTRLLLRYLPAHLAMISGSLFRQRTPGTARAYLGGKLAFLAALPRLMRKRMQIQRMRVACPEQLERMMDRGGFSTLLKKLLKNMSHTPKSGAAPGA
jgi:GT2 family glycosyltransferase